MSRSAGRHFAVPSTWRSDDEEPSTSRDFVNEKHCSRPVAEGDSKYVKRRFKGGRHLGGFKLASPFA
jgi:hypothetical protein